MVYKYATGWLGWSHQEAMTTPIPLILLALEGKVSFLKVTSPFGNNKDDEKQPVRPNKRKATADLRRYLRARALADKTRTGLGR